MCVTNNKLGDAPPPCVPEKSFNLLVSIFNTLLYTWQEEEEEEEGCAKILLKIVKLLTRSATPTAQGSACET